MRQFRIAIVSTFPPLRDGIAQYTKYLSEALAQQGAKVFIFANEHAQATKTVSVRNVWQQGRLSLTLFRAVRSTHFDMLHIQFHPALYGPPFISISLTFLLLLWKRTPVFVTLHTLPNLNRVQGHRKIGARALLRFFSYRATLVVHTEQMAEALRVQYGIPAEKMIVIPMGNTSARSLQKSTAKKLLGVKSQFIILAPVLLRPGTHTEIALSSIETLRRKYGSILFVFVGSPPRAAENLNYTQKVTAIIQHRHLGENVRILSAETVFDDPKHRWFAAADVLLYLHEDYHSFDCSISLQNALIFGKMVIASAVPKFVLASELLQNTEGRCCIIPAGPKPKIIQDLSRAILFCLRHDLRPYEHRFADVARRYRWSTSARRLLDAYRGKERKEMSR